MCLVVEWSHGVSCSISRRVWPCVYALSGNYPIGFEHCVVSCVVQERVTLETRCSRAWVDDLTPLVARSRFRRYTYTRSPMRDDPGDRLVLVVQERVTLETSAVVRCAGPEWLLARAASRGACRERESRWSRRCPDPNRSRARKPSRRAATYNPVSARATGRTTTRGRHARSVTAPRPDALERIPRKVCFW